MNKNFASGIIAVSWARSTGHRPSAEGRKSGRRIGPAFSIIVSVAVILAGAALCVGDKNLPKNRWTGASSQTPGSGKSP